MVRVSGICNHDPATTVLAHVRLIGISGMGLKSPDLLGAWSCSACHEYVDSKGGDPYLRRLMLLEGMARTQAELLKQGHITEAEVSR